MAIAFSGSAKHGETNDDRRDGAPAGKGRSVTENTIRVVIPLTFRKKNGRPKILPPADHAPAEARTQDPHVLRAIGRAWSWRRKLERGEVSTIQDIATTERSPTSMSVE
jgi:hypothetical protein